MVLLWWCKQNRSTNADVMHNYLISWLMYNCSAICLEPLQPLLGVFYSDLNHFDNKILSFFSGNKVDETPFLQISEIQGGYKISTCNMSLWLNPISF